MPELGLFAALDACFLEQVLMQGHWLERDVKVGTSLLDMYYKCVSLLLMKVAKMIEEVEGTLGMPPEYISNALLELDHDLHGDIHPKLKMLINYIDNLPPV